MSFVQDQFLWWGLAALAIPLIIHLLFRRRSRRVELGTLRFLRVVLEQNAQRRRIKRWLLLALRAACVSLLFLLFARPYLVAREHSAGKDRFVAILIDRSASMRLKDKDSRLIDQAIARAKKIVRDAGDNTRIELA